MGSSTHRSDEILKAALVLPSEQRRAFLDMACGSDGALRGEVEGLLRQSDASSPTVAISAAQRLSSEQMLGPYRVETMLGEGGMGVVYRAEDTRLRRRVALKFVKSGLGERFRREAQAVSALNHPNVAMLYDICSHEGAHFLVFEYVDGMPLRGPLPLPLALDYAIQIAQALEAAHAAGIIHRDLKPSNIMATNSGVIKVLDFGLAKQTDASADDAKSTISVTREGAIAGTAAYMSPEQAEGKKLDSRSDIFSFGAVLYELISGRRAFTGKTAMSVIAAVLEREPEPLENIPPELKQTLCRCLRKDPARRWQHIADVRLALEDVKAGLGQQADPARPRPRWRVATFSCIGALLLVATGYESWMYGKKTPETPVYQFEQVTDDPGQESQPSLSPDGKSVVYSSRETGHWHVYLLRIGGKNPTDLTPDSDADDTEPAFSPDAERIAFRSERDGGGIFVMGSTGESVRRLTDSCYYPAWSPDAKEIACSTANPYRPDVREFLSSQILAVDVESGEKRVVSGGVQDAVQPSWSPDGRRIAFWGVREGTRRDIMTIGRDGRDPVSVTDDHPLDWNPVWSPDGKYIYFASDRGGAMNLWRIAVLPSGKPKGAPEPVGVPATYASSVSFSRDGRRMAYSNCQRSSNIHVASFDPDREMAAGSRALTKGVKETLYPSFSRDGKYIAYTSLGSQEDLMLVRSDGGGQRRITEDAARDRGPRWSPAGDQIAFMSTRTGRFEIWTIRPDGSAPAQVTSESPRGGVVYPAWSPDARRISYNLPDEMGFIIDAGKNWREQRPRPALADLPAGSWLWLNDWSHDGTKIGGTVLKLGNSLGVGAYNVESKKFERYTSFGQLPRWLPDGRRLLFHAGGRILVAEPSGASKEVLSVKEGTINPYFDLSWDGRSIAYSVEAMDSDVWIMTRRN